MYRANQRWFPCSDSYDSCDVMKKWLAAVSMVHDWYGFALSLGAKCLLIICTVIRKDIDSHLSKSSAHLILLLKVKRPR